MSTVPNLPNLPFEPSPASFDAWLAALPADNPGEYRRALNVALQGVGGDAVPAEFRHHVLEKLLPVVLIESRRIIQLINSKPEPLDDKTRKLAWLAVQFPGELGKAYLQLALGNPDSLAIQPIFRALECLDAYSLHLALLYEHCPSSFWHRVFELYAVAESLGEADWRCQDSGDRPSASDTIQSLLKRIVTLRLAAPSQLERPHILRLHELLKSADGLIQLSAGAREGGRTADFTFDLQVSAEPLAFEAARTDGAQGQRFLYFQDLNSRLSLLGQHSVPDMERLDEGFVAHLQTRLGGLPSYQLDRKSLEATLMTEFDDIAHRLTALEMLGDSPESDPVKALSLEILPMDFELADTQKPMLSKSAGTFRPGTSASGGKAAAWQLQRGEYPCRITRCDTPGYYLLEPTGVSLDAGALVAVNTDNKLIQLGVIGARPPIGTDGRVAFELLAEDPATVNVYVDNAPGEPHRSLLATLSRTPSGGRGLFTKSLRLRCGDTLTLERDGRRQRIRVVRIREWTPRYGVFEIAMAF